MSQPPRRGGRGGGPPKSPSRGGPPKSPSRGGTPSRGGRDSRGASATGATDDGDDSDDPLSAQGAQGLVPRLQVNPSAVLSVQWENREIPIVAALKELEKIGGQEKISQDQIQRARGLARTINGVLNRANNFNEALHLRFLQLSEQLTRVFTQALHKDVQSSIDRATGFRDNIYRTQKEVNLLLRRGFATEYQLTTIVPSLFGHTPSRGIYEDLAACNTLGMSFTEVMNIAERSRWRRLLADHARATAPGGNNIPREPPEMQKQDITIARGGTDKQATGALAEFPEEHHQRRVKMWQPRLQTQAWDIIEGFLSLRPETMEYPRLKKELKTCRTPMSKPPPATPKKADPSQQTPQDAPKVPSPTDSMASFQPVTPGGKRRATKTGDGIAASGKKDKKVPPVLGRRDQAEEDHQRALEELLALGMRFLADQRDAPIATDRQTLENAINNARNPLPNPTPLQERIWRWSVQQVRLFLNGNLQATSDSEFLLQDVRDESKYKEVSQLLDAMKMSGKYGLQVWQLRSLVTGMSLMFQNATQVHTGMEYLSQLCDYFSNVVHRRRQQNRDAGRYFTIGDDYFDYYPRYGTWSPLQVGLRTFQDLTVTESTMNPAPDVVMDETQYIDGWFTDETLFTLMRFLIPGAGVE